MGHNEGGVPEGVVPMPRKECLALRHQPHVQVDE